MKQTAVEFLIEEMQKRIPPFYAHYVMNMDEVYEQAKEMEKQQIIDAFDEGQEYEYQYHINSTPKFDSQTYFTETYGSEGSDSTLNSSLKSTLNASSQTEISDEEIRKKSMELFRPVSYQECFEEGAKWYREQMMEISDEEIEKCIVDGMHDFYKGGFIEGAKWYREQLKQRQ